MTATSIDSGVFLSQSRSPSPELSSDSYPCTIVPQNSSPSGLYDSISRPKDSLSTERNSPSAGSLKDSLSVPSDSTTKTRSGRSNSIADSWGVTSIGRGFDWRWQDDSSDSEDEPAQSLSNDAWGSKVKDSPISSTPPPQPTVTSSKGILPLAIDIPSVNGRGPLTLGPLPMSELRPLTPPDSLGTSPRVLPTRSASTPLLGLAALGQHYARPPLSPRHSRRRSSQKRISLIAGRSVPVTPLATTPPEMVELTQTPPIPLNLNITPNSPVFIRFSSSASIAPPPTPGKVHLSQDGMKSIDNYIIVGEAGRGAYGLVKRAREIQEDGSFGPLLIIKQVIKSRILADCWKRHPVHGTIPIEIFVMSAMSGIKHPLPARPPWDPSRLSPTPSWEWIEGQECTGHPSIIPLLDFFEDAHYYYLILPAASPSLPNHPSIGPAPSPAPSDLFDLVELYPLGLPAPLVRTYLGQIADALAFLHKRNICHRDVKDENIVLGEGGRCWLIDFGSSGIVRKGGWDTFSGTLDYAGPEILRGERYSGPPQDVWAFGILAFVLLTGECPFSTPAEAAVGLEPMSKALMALNQRCAEGHEEDGREDDNGGRLIDARSLVMSCLQIDVLKRPTFAQIIKSRYLAGGEKEWGDVEDLTSPITSPISPTKSNESSG